MLTPIRPQKESLEMLDTGSLSKPAGCRSEGPTVNSPVREGGGNAPFRSLSAERAPRVVWAPRSTGGLWEWSRADPPLTDGAINCRSFGPGSKMKPYQTLHSLRILGSAFLLLLAGVAAAAQSTTPATVISESSYQALRWRCIGPHRGGRALAVSGVRGQPENYYFGAVGGGVWKTTNGGEVWEPVFDEQPFSSIGALAVAPSNPDVIYAGSGEADVLSDISLEDGIYKSTDGGKTWAHLVLQDTRQIGRILV